MEDTTIAVRRGRPRPQQPETPKDNINDAITAKEVRLIGDDGEQLGVIALADALARAEEAGLDLVEVAAKADPPVCRIMDYGKYLYQQQKKLHDAKKNQKQVQVKEVKLRPGTEEGDYQVKLRNLVRFLEQGNRVKVGIWFRGREIAHRDLGMKVLERIREDVQEMATVEQEPKMEGRQMQMVLAPAKK